MPSLPFKAAWIGPSSDPREDLGIFKFVCEFDLEDEPGPTLIRVSADQRYRLVANGEPVIFGPQRGDLDAWRYEFLDLAPFLRKGRNRLEATVWNFGHISPMAQISRRAGFVFDVVSPEDEPEGTGAMRTPGAWTVQRDTRYDFKMMHSDVHSQHFYIDVGPGETFDPSAAPEEPRQPHFIQPAHARGRLHDAQWQLLPRSIPPMGYEPREATPPRRQDGQTWLFDAGELLCAFPRLTLRGPVGAKVRVVYAESLWNPDGTKGNRDEIEGKTMKGIQDEVTLGEGDTVFEPLWWRTYRYLEVRADVPIEVELVSIETGYPLPSASSFEADDPWVPKLWEVSYRTAARCAGETYFDCPYYEQLQYAGDTRIQAMIGYYLGPDRDLQRNAVDQFDRSKRADGLTHSRYPDRVAQVIPPFTLWHVMMRQDQRLYDRPLPVDPQDPDPVDTVGLDFVSAFNRLNEQPVDETFWNFADWTPEWPEGTPPGGVQSTVHLLTLYLAHAATEISLDEPGERGDAKAKALYAVVSGQMERKNGLVKHKRDPEWMASEHAEALWRLLQKKLRVKMDPWPAEALDAANAVRCTFYFSYYKHLAMQPKDYMAILGPWKEQIEDGLSTFVEVPEPTRSDCHAWSAHPILGFFQIVAGVESAGSGWSRARIAPNPGSLRRFDAKIAHPKGELRVRYEDGKVKVDSPIPYDLVWEDR
ncbi:hypothetical protein BH11ARM2_BH11ARM2_10890 [soil metagenome]